MRTPILCGSVLAAGLVTALLAQQSDNDTGRMTDETSGMTGKEADRGAREENFAAMTPDQRFVTMQFKCNLFEVQLGRMVADKLGAGNMGAAPGAGTETPGRTEQPNMADIRQFAQKMAEDHTKANQQLREYAGRKNITLNQRLEDWQQGLLQAISRLPTQDLARQYVFHQVGGHHTSILENRYGANNAQDPELKTLASRMVPDLQSHLQQADRLAQQFVGIRGTPISPEGR